MTGTQDQDLFRDGVNTAAPNYRAPSKLTEGEGAYTSRRRANVDLKRGYMEPHSWYDKCYVRQRNQGKI